MPSERPGPAQGSWKADFEQYTLIIGVFERPKRAQVASEARWSSYFERPVASEARWSSYFERICEYTVITDVFERLAGARAQGLRSPLRKLLNRLFLGPSNIP